jgi:hypothetical protein
VGSDLADGPSVVPLTRVFELGQARAIEHGSSPSGRWLRARRLRIALWIAVLEGVLVLIGAIPRWPALLVAAAVILVYLFAGRRLASYSGRQITWIAAASQVLVALVPVLLILVGTLALILVAVLAIVALIALFSDRS